MFEDKQWPTKELLDEVATLNNPCRLEQNAGRQLQPREQLRPPGIRHYQRYRGSFGGEIQRDPVTGEATGIFKEQAQKPPRVHGCRCKRVERTPEEQAAELSQRVGGTCWQYTL